MSQKQLQVLRSYMPELVKQIRDYPDCSERLCMWQAVYSLLATAIAAHRNKQDDADQLALKAASEFQRLEADISGLRRADSLIQDLTDKLYPAAQVPVEPARPTIRMGDRGAINVSTARSSK